MAGKTKGNKAVLSIKLGACLTMPSKTFYEQLNRTALDCNIARNAMLRFWQRWREDNPNWVPEQRRNKDGTPKFRKDGTPVVENEIISQDISRMMYHAGTAAAPPVASDITSSLSQEVQDMLVAKVPWNSGLQSDRRWQAILAYEISAPSYRSIMIPVPAQKAVLCYDGTPDKLLGKEQNPDAPRNVFVRKCGESSCVLMFPLFSKKSSRSKLTAVVRLNVRKMSRGHKGILHAICRGYVNTDNVDEGGETITAPVKMCGSKIIKKKKDWFLQLCYEMPPAVCTLDTERVGILYPSPPGERKPFILRLPSGNNVYIGDGVMLHAEYERITTRRRVIRARYKTGSRNGRGKSGAYRNTRPHERAFKDLQDRFTKQLVSDIVKTCERNDCGQLLYMEPTKPLREIEWFGSRNIPFSWVEFAGRLENKLTQRGIAQQKTTRINVGDHKEMFKWGKKSEPKVKLSVASAADQSKQAMTGT